MGGVLRVFASGLLVLGGGAVALGAGLFAFIAWAYLEWDAAFSAVPTVLLLSSTPTIAGLALIFIGGALRGAEGARTAGLALAFWLGVVGASLVLGPLFNLIWIGLRESSFTAPGTPLSPYLVAMLAGVVAMLIAVRIYPGKSDA